MTTGMSANARTVLARCVAALAVVLAVSCSPAQDDAAPSEAAADAQDEIVPYDPDAVDFFEVMLEADESVYAREKEEIIIRHFFRDRREGVFLDVGCYLPKDFSLTYYLEAHLDWSGVAVDAQAELRELWKVRPGSQFFAYAISNESGGELVLHKAGAVSAVDREQVALWQERTEGGFPIVEVRVPTITLDDLLAEAGIDSIDFLKIDINGHELAAPQGFDIQRFRPQLVNVEQYAHHREAMLEYFTANGYELIERYVPLDATNLYFKPVDYER